ncbi:phosphotransferase [Arthrobacter sp. YAF34]|uniref:phosphotransferase n=1 Tax=Arthrobacter sp. YAF34 TaxID=3233083 RepID=UPI003F8DCC95
MSTLERDASAAWSALRSIWSDLEWTSPVYRHGAFHHVAVLGSTSVVRVSFAANHEAQIGRQSAVLLAVGNAGLKTRIPRLLRTLTGDTWSAMACTVIKGAHMPDRSWHEARHYFAGILNDLQCAQLLTGLPAARSWCGGNFWPEVVERITADSGSRVRKAAQTVVREVLSLEEGVCPSLVHGDFGPHNILWDESTAPGLIDFDNACAADPAIDVAPLIGFYGAAKVGEIVDAHVLARAKVYRASLPLQIAAAAALGTDRRLQSHALSNFARRLETGSLHDPAAT